MRWLRCFIVFILSLFTCLVVVARTDVSKDIERAIAHYDRGSYNKAVKTLSFINTMNQAELNTIPVEARLYLADSYLKLGRLAKAQYHLELLATAINQGMLSLDTFEKILFTISMAQLYRHQGYFEKAIKKLQWAIAQAETVKNYTPSQLLGGIYNELGLVYQVQSSESNNTEPLIEAAFEKALNYSYDQNQHLHATVAINLLRFTINHAQINKIDQRLAQAKKSLSALPEDAEKARQLLSLGDLSHQVIKQEYRDNANYRLGAFHHYRHALKISKAINNTEIMSYAYGAIGLLYEEEKRYQEAQAVGLQAIFHAQAGNSRYSLYQWQWLVARVLKAQQRIEASGVMFEQTMFTFRDLLPRLAENSLRGSEKSVINRGLYREIVAPLYYQYADLQLKRAALQKKTADKQRILFAVREVIENAKKNELIDYFGNECELPETNVKDLEELTADSVVIYPIILPDRIELLVTYDSDIKQVSSLVGADELTRTVRQFRQQIQTDWGSEQYLQLGQQLYQWLIAPLLPILNDQAPETLVMIPDGPLRTIPFAALYDGQHYLIHHYAIVSSLGLSLVDPRAITEMPINAYIGGLSEAVQGFPALPQVGHELRQVRSLTQAVKHYENQDFTQKNVVHLSSKAYNVAHIATHAQFSPDHNQSYFLTYDNRFTLSRLKKNMLKRQLSGGTPLELLVLSACETALGDDQAALGLAGMAVQTGVRSAVASLWSINDSASSELMAEFYRQLSNKEGTKAQWLRQAQLKLITDKRYQHPSYWAAFLLLGNWL